MTLLVTDDLDVHSLSTIGLQARIGSLLYQETDCIGSLLTPANTPRVSSALLAGPLVAFGFVFIVGPVALAGGVGRICLPDPPPRERIVQAEHSRRLSFSHQLSDSNEYPHQSHRIQHSNQHPPLEPFPPRCQQRRQC